jgi:hypothetical protein
MKIENLDIKKNFYSSLNERQQRHFLGLEAKGLGHGGIQLVSQAFGAGRNRVSRGLQEVKSGEQLPVGRIRKEGGGRKKK